MAKAIIDLTEFLNLFWKNLYEQSNKDLSEVPENIFNTELDKEELETNIEKTYNDVLKFPLFLVDFTKNSSFEKLPLKKDFEWKKLCFDHLMTLWKVHFMDIEREYLVAFLKALSFDRVIDLLL